jgi:hypothetical protein
MIRINLLPVEKRKAERTPVPRFFMIVATAGAAAGIFFYVMYILLEINNVSNQIQDTQNEISALRPKVAEFDRLTQQKAAALAKLSEITSVLTRDIEIGYWRAANALWDVISSHHRVWIDDFRMMDARTAQGEYKRVFPDGKDMPPYGFTMKCHVAGAEVKEMSRFREALKSHPVLLYCMPTINFNPDWKIDEERDFSERYSISFSISLFGSMDVPKAPAPGTPPQAVPASAGGAAPPAPKPLPPPTPVTTPPGGAR